MHLYMSFFFCNFAAKFVVRIGTCVYAYEESLRKLVKQ